MKKEVKTDKAPQAIGPYSQGIIAPPFVFCSGQIPLDPATGQLIAGGIEEQTRRVLSERHGRFGSRRKLDWPRRSR